MVTTRSLGSTLDRMMTLNRALDHAFNSAWSDNGRVWVPAIDVVEKKEAYVLYAELSGVDVSKVDVSFEQNILTIRGEKQTLPSAGDAELRVYAAERVSGSFERGIRLPEFVDGERISAEFNNGVLTVTVPKAKAAQHRKIAINGAEPLVEASTSTN